MNEVTSVREGVGKREFPDEEGNERSECWKTVGFQRPKGTRGKTGNG